MPTEFVLGTGEVRMPGSLGAGDRRAAPRGRAAQPRARGRPAAPPPGRGFAGRAGPFHPGSESDVGVNENKPGARGEGRRACRRAAPGLVERRRSGRAAGAGVAPGVAAPVPLGMSAPRGLRASRGARRPGL